MLLKIEFCADKKNEMEKNKGYVAITLCFCKDFQE
ncbi:hypothetical protein C8N25_113105 [Algoriphagus antarcticus]|uniref:Uncharacterized protein n=1 Tax=Algoriphagus antarcticus TaxID=238540 RepID=A0A3E0DSE1_9BACT|nr:hypothetical protein C8N25_113105 [Algoriphagus antarcticus]